MENKNTTPEKPKPSVLEVARVLHEKGLNDHYLWDKQIDAWWLKDYQTWEVIKSGEGVKKKKPKKEGPTKPRGWAVDSSPQQVRRQSDGKIYKSINDCSRQVGVPLTTLRRKIEKGFGFEYVISLNK